MSVEGAEEKRMNEWEGKRPTGKEEGVEQRDKMKSIIRVKVVRMIKTNYVQR